MDTLVSILLFLLLLLHAPLFVVIAAAALYGFFSSDISLAVVAVEIYRITETPMLVALPLLTFAGYLIAEGQSPQRLLLLSRAWLGWMPAGLAIISLFVCALFTAITGASGVTIVAIGALLYPALRQGGYKKSFSLGLVTSSGSLGLLLVPSMPLILYGIIVQQMNIGRSFELAELFLAGILPAILMVVLLAAWSLWVSRSEKHALTAFSWVEARRALFAARWELPLPVIFIGGIYGGLFAISEVAAITVLYVLCSQLFLYRELSVREIPDIMIRSSVMVGEIILILSVSLAFTNFLVDAEVPTRLFDLIQGNISDKYVFLLLLNVFLLALGAVLDIFSALIIMVPLLLPVALHYGIDPIHLGIIFLANMQLGYFTPPVGMNLFIASFRFQESIVELYRAILPFFFVLLVAVILITYLPWLSLWLPGLLL